MLKSLILASAAFFVATTPAFASGSDGAVSMEVASTLGPNKFVWAETAAAEPVSIVISIADQRAYVYRGDTMVAATSVSTGKDGKETPTGTYTILQKKEDHKSNLYNAAPMPFMQRLTWDGIAIHAGRNPGFPASHGCIRVPTAFAKKLFEVTDLGTTVTVIDESVDPTLPPPQTYAALDIGAVASANAAQLSSIRR